MDRQSLKHACTGANSGLGVETARALAYGGARVIITSRNLTAGQKVADELNAAGLKVLWSSRKLWQPQPSVKLPTRSYKLDVLNFQGRVEVQQLDLADLSSVRQLATQLNNEQSIELLILNAGVMACPQAYTKDNFELQVGTNHFGHFRLTKLLLNKLQTQVHLLLSP